MISCRKIRNRILAGLLVAAIVSLGCSAGVSPAEGVATKVDAKAVTIKDGERVLLKYRYGDVPFKPYVKELYTPGGMNILLDAPHDHLHHHGLMLALGIDGIDFWGETPGCGSQQKNFGPFVPAEAPQAPGGTYFFECLQWKDPKTDKTFVKENRRLGVGWGDEGKATLVTWQSVFTVGEGFEKVTFDGRHYFGLGMRFVRAMDAGKFFNGDKAEGKTYRGDEKLVRSRWCAYSVKVDGKMVTVAMFDSPKNVRHPAVWFTMSKPFAYLAGTLGLYKEPLELKEGQKLDLRYGIAVWDGEPSVERIESVYRKWSK